MVLKCFLWLFQIAESVCCDNKHMNLSLFRGVFDQVVFYFDLPAKAARPLVSALIQPTF